MRTMDIAVLTIEILLLLAFVGAGFILKNYLPSYFTEKGKNLATKEDIAEITRKIEAVKLKIEASKAVQQAKRNLKHEACLEALCLVDAHLSHKKNQTPNHALRRTRRERRGCHRCVPCAGSLNLGR